MTNLNPSPLKIAGELPRHLLSQGARQFFSRDLNAHDLAMMPHTELPESHPAQCVFARARSCAALRPSPLGRIPCATKDTPRPVCPILAAQPAAPVPGSQPSSAQHPSKRRQHVMLPCGLLARPKIAFVVGIHSVRDRTRSRVPRDNPSSTVNNSSLQWKQRVASLRAYAGFSSSRVSTTSTGIACSRANASASSAAFAPGWQNPQ